MKLSEKEEFITEYKFNDSGNKTHQIVLTSKRLVVINGNREESYPLSKITAIMVVYKQWKVLLYLGYLLLGLLIFSFRYGMPGGFEILILIIPPALFIFLGLKKRTLLTINQMGGKKNYRVNKYDYRLDEFIEKVNEALF